MVPKFVIKPLKLIWRYNQNIIVLISGHDYQAPLVKHASQKDYATGFGGKYGVQKGSFDQSALGWDHIEKVDKHDSQVRFFYQIDWITLQFCF